MRHSARADARPPSAHALAPKMARVHGPPVSQTAHPQRLGFAARHFCSNVCRETPSAASRRSSLHGHSYLVNVQFRCLGLWSPQPPVSLVVHLYWWGDSSQLTCQEWLPAVHVQRLRM